MKNGDTYISVKQISKCECCGREEDLRMGYCFDCAEAQTIIVDGTDMYDKGLPDDLKTESKSMDKVRFLIRKGWKPPEDKPVTPSD